MRVLAGLDAALEEYRAFEVAELERWECFIKYGFG
jgi:hypothetical protein